MPRPLAALVLLLLAWPSATRAADQIGPWDVKSLKATEVKPEWGKAAGKAKEVYYPGEPFKGKPTRVFAYYARPASGDGPFPAVVCVHGGGGKAFQAWAEHWAARGYCALAMDLAGNGPDGKKLPDGGPDQSDDAKFRDFDDQTARDMWTYHAVAAVIRGHNLVRSLPEVDKDRTAVTGISWGGYLTCITSGVDDRFKAAVPVYGCGFLHENSAWVARLGKMTAEQRKRWVDTFDPSKYLPNATLPMLFLNGTNDFAYPMDSYQKCYELVKGPRTVSVRVRLPHGHIWTFKEVDAFIDSHLTKGDPLPNVGAMTRDGDTVSAKVAGKAKLKAAQLHYAVAEGPWQKREWKSSAAEIKDGVVSAKLPADRPLVYELAVTDERGLEVTAPHAVLKADKEPPSPVRLVAPALPVAPAPAISPTARDVAYGTHPRQVLDFWKADSAAPTPVVFLIHGGGWVNGDKSGYRHGVKRYLDAGISVVAINYRMVTQADEAKVMPPVQWPLADAARAVQFVRSKSKEWNLDKTRVGATGGSAGGCSSLYLAFVDDLAKINSEDPVARESTRLTCVAVTGAQTTLDPKILREWMPNARYGGHAFGVRTPTNRDGAFPQFHAQREKLLPWIEQYSPLSHVSKDDPPVFMEYPSQTKPPVKGEAQADPTHSALLGMILEEKLKAVGVECVLVYPGKVHNKYKVSADFLINRLKAK